MPMRYYEHSPPRLETQHEQSGYWARIRSLPLGEHRGVAHCTPHCILSPCSIPHRDSI